MMSDLAHRKAVLLRQLRFLTIDQLTISIQYRGNQTCLFQRFADGNADKQLVSSAQREIRFVILDDLQQHVKNCIVAIGERLLPVIDKLDDILSMCAQTCR
jgi:hypothetical protein